MSPDPNEQFLRLADLVARTASEQERAVLMQAAFGRGARELVPMLIAGAEAIRAQERAARDTGKIIASEIIKKAEEFDDAWSDAWLSFKATAVNNIFPIGERLGDLIDTARNFLGMMNAIKNFDFDRGIEHFLNEFGPPVSQAGPKGDRLDGARTVIPPSARAGAGAAAAQANEFDRANEAIRRRIALLELEASVFGKSTFEAEKARVAFELLEAAKAANLAITPELRAQIDALATAYGAAAVRLEALDEAQQAAAKSAEELARAQEESIRRMEAMRDAATDSMKGFVRDLIDGKNAADALNNAMARLGDRLIDMGLNSIFTPIFGQSGTIAIEGTTP